MKVSEAKTEIRGAGLRWGTSRGQAIHSQFCHFSTLFSVLGWVRFWAFWLEIIKPQVAAWVGGGHGRFCSRGAVERYKIRRMHYWTNLPLRGYPSKKEFSSHRSLSPKPGVYWMLTMFLTPSWLWRNFVAYGYLMLEVQVSLPLRLSPRGWHLPSWPRFWAFL